MTTARAYTGLVLNTGFKKRFNHCAKKNTRNLILPHLHPMFPTHYGRPYVLEESIKMNNFEIDIDAQYVPAFNGRLDLKHFLD